MPSFRPAVRIFLAAFLPPHLRKYMFVNRHISIRARLSYVRRVSATREAINRVLSNGSALRAYIRKYFQPWTKCSAQTDD